MLLKLINGPAYRKVDNGLKMLIEPSSTGYYNQKVTLRKLYLLHHEALFYTSGSSEYE